MSTRIAVVLGVAALVLTMGLGGCRRTARPQEGTSPDETSQPGTSRSAADSSVRADPSGDESATASEVANDGAPAVAPAPPVVPVAAPKGPDPRYATPKETVKTVLEALLHGDKAAFINGINAPDEMAPLVDGMFCRVSIPGRSMTKVVRLPRSSVSFEGYAWAVNSENRIERRNVEVVRNEGDFAFIARGIEEGDLVVITRLVNPLPGSKVQFSTDEVLPTDGLTSRTDNAAAGQSASIPETTQESGQS